MSKRYLTILCLSVLFISCNSDINKESSLNTNIKSNNSIYIESGTDIRGMTIETSNIQKNSTVIQNDAINTNENGTIRIGK